MVSTKKISAYHKLENQKVFCVKSVVPIVGIGTTITPNKLTVFGALSADNAVFGSNDTTYLGGESGVAIVSGSKSVVRVAGATGTSNTNFGEISFLNDEVSLTKTAAISALAGPNPNPEQSAHLTFSTHNGTAYAERMRLDRQGNVGIGTSAPLGILHTLNTTGAGTASEDTIWNSSYGNGTSPGAGITTQSARGTPAAPSSILANDQLLSLSARGYAGTGFTTLGKARINIIAAENWSAGAQGTHITFDTTAAGGTTRSEKLRIGSNGNVGIGLTNPTQKLQVAGIIAPDADGTRDLGTSSLKFKDIYATNNVIQTSDARMKRDIQETDLGLDFINKLRPVSYYWKQGADQKLHYGLIAQETEQAVSEAKQANGRTDEVDNVIVTHDKETDRYGVRYSELISPLIKAVQELYNKIMGHDEQLATQARQIANVEASNEQLKAENVAKDKEIKDLKQENSAIKSYLCSKDPAAPICK